MRNGSLQQLNILYACVCVSYSSTVTRQLRSVESLTSFTVFCSLTRVARRRVSQLESVPPLSFLLQVAEANPGVNGWAPNPDPLSQIGDETWDDYAVGVSVTFSSDAPGRSSRMLSSANAESAASTRAGGAEAVAGTPSSSSRQRSSQERLRQWRIGHGGPAPSSVTSSTIAYTLREGDAPIYLVPCDAADPAQAWSYGTTSPGYLSNAAGKFAVPQCLNVAGW